MAYEAVVGLEVHAQLKTATKIFCGCRATFGAPPNSLTCPVCLGLPGALPVLNAQAVALALRFGVAVDCRIEPRSVFARKNYFYPDVPKNYQITQYELPLLAGGAVAVRAGNGIRRVRIERAHLEEDAGKLVHAAGGDARTLVDLNRAGVPLLEIVSAPELRGGEEALAYLTALRRLLLYLDVCDGDMEKGSLRCDANVSIRPTGSTGLGGRIEIKNLNSFRAVAKAIDHETARQAALLDRGEPVRQQTRAWDADAGRTVALRAKEFPDDYRYFADPDLPPLLVSDEAIEKARAEVPEQPLAREERLRHTWGLPAAAAALLTDSRDLADYFEAVAGALGDGTLAANWILDEVLRVLGERRVGVREFPITPADLAALLALVRAGEISGTAGKAVFAAMLATGESASGVVARLGLRLERDASAVAAAVERVLAAHPREVASYRRGKTGVLAFLVGKVMNATQGRADPALVNRLLRGALERPDPSASA